MIPERSQRGSFLVEVFPAAVYVALIFYGGSIRLAAPPIDVGLPFDKVLHLFAFGGMQLLFVRAARYGWPRVRFERHNFGAVVAAGSVGLLLELWQATLPHRSAELMDFLADSLGALLMATTLQLGGRKFLKRPAESHSQAEPR